MSIMQMQLARLFSALVLTAASSLGASTAIAQTETEQSDFEPVRLETIPEAFDRTFFEDSGTFYYNRNIWRQANYILGITGFPDVELESDAHSLNKLYNEVLEQQVSSDPIIRTPDLPNPFNTSIRSISQPRRAINRLEGVEFILETVPVR
ncbi:MAG: hypothetical protein F6K47_01585 [Symploca sp. SIO2E6]|nr:hypothetical protein [Symploca sp. SIO2E6]